MRRPRTGFPYLDGRDDSGPRVLAFAHRGGSYHPEIEGLENTLTAFRHAFDLGYRYLETDVHVTRDGVVMAFHDHVLDRVTGQKGAVSKLEREELRDARIGGSETIPTMTALFEEFSEAHFNIDLKSDAVVEPMLDLIRRTRREESVLVGTFSQKRLDRFRRLAGGRVATAAGPLDVAVIRLAPAPAVSRWAGGTTGPRGAALQVPRRRKGLPILTPGLVDRAHALGMHVHVWTVDDPEEMHELIDLGVDGLMTDRTDLLRDVLQERGLWEGPA